MQSRISGRMQQSDSLVSGRQGYASLERENETGASTTTFPLADFSQQQYGFVRQFCATSGPPQIVAVAFLTMLGYGAFVAILPKVSTQRFAVLNYGYDGDDCNTFENYADKPKECLLGSSDAQDAHAFSELVGNMLIVVSGPLFGSISDTHGRRVLFILGTVLAILCNFAFLYVCLRPKSNPWIFYYVRSLHGLVNWTALALAALADVMPPQLRAPAVGLLMAAYWFGVCIGPTFAVFLGYMNAVYFSCFLGLIAIAVAVLFVPETLQPALAEEARRQHELENSNMTKFDLIIWNVFRPFRELSIINRDGFFRLLSMLAFFNGMVTSGDKVLILYYVDSKLSFTVKDTAVMLLLYGFGTVLAQGVILKPLNDFIGERLIVLDCFVAAVFANTLYGLANGKEALYAGIILASFTGMAFPTFSAIKANNVDESEQGRIQGALYSILALASGIGPLAMRYVDHIASDTFLGPGAMFLFAAFLQLIAASFACFLPKDRSNSRSFKTKEEEQIERGEEMVIL